MNERLFLLGTLLLGGCGGAAPELSNFQIATSPAVRGQQIDGTVDVSDPDGLGGIRLRATLTGPASAELDLPAQGASDAITEATFALVLLLSTTAPAGAYRAELVATDADDLESDPVGVDLDVQ